MEKNDETKNTIQLESGVKKGPVMYAGLHIPEGYVGFPTAESGYVIVSNEDYLELGGTRGVLAKHDSTRGQ